MLANGALLFDGIAPVVHPDTYVRHFTPAVTKGRYNIGAFS